MLATTWTFGSFLWWTLAAFFWFAVIWMFIALFADILRRRDLSGWAKAGWIALIVILPFLGALIYVIVRPPIAAEEYQVVGGGYGSSRAVAGGNGASAGASAVSEIATAADLKDRGVISDSEFEEIKRRALL